MTTQTEKKDGTMAICTAESSIIKDSAALTERWAILGMKPPKLRDSKMKMEDMVGTKEWDDL